VAADNVYFVEAESINCIHLLGPAVSFIRDIWSNNNCSFASFIGICGVLLQEHRATTHAIRNA
jgi:hypothetical protein